MYLVPYVVFSPDWDEVSQDAKALITALIQVDVKKRLTCAQALEMPWLVKKVAENKNLLGRVGTNLVTHFNARKKLKVIYF